MNFSKKILLKFIVLTVIFQVNSSWAQSGQIGVASFAVNGAKEHQYLSTAARDAVVGALIKKSLEARSISNVLDPDKLRSVAQGGGKDAILVTGRVNVVG